MSPSDHKITKDLSEIYSNSLVSEICRLKKWLIMCPCWMIFWHKRKQQKTLNYKVVPIISLCGQLYASPSDHNIERKIFSFENLFMAPNPFVGNGAVVWLFHFLGPLEENFEFDFEFFIFLFLEEAFLLSLMWVWHCSFICWRWVVKKKEKCIYYLVKSEIIIELNQKKKKRGETKVAN